jgi:hypothetical protein
MCGNPDLHPSRSQELSRLKIESRRAVNAHNEVWRLYMETWKVCRLAIADSHHFNAFEDLDPDPHKCKSDPDPHQIRILYQSEQWGLDADPQHCLTERMNRYCFF